MNTPDNPLAIKFIATTLSDIPLLHKWFNTPHVQQFYSLRNWTEKEVLQKIEPYITGKSPVFGFMVVVNEIPIGYTQYCRVADFPWPEQDLPDKIIEKCAGLDLFIGEPDFLNKGYGVKVIKEFLIHTIWPQFNCCMVDPDIKNTRAIHCYQKLGFDKYKIIHMEDALKKPVDLQLMIAFLNKEC